MPKLHSREVDARFQPILDAVDDVADRFELLAGEQIYMLTVLLVGCIDDAPPDVRDLFTDAAIDALRRGPRAGRRLEDLCLRGEITK